MPLVDETLPNEFTDFGQKKVAHEGPVSSRFLPRAKKRKTRRHKRSQKRV